MLAQAYCGSSLGLNQSSWRFVNLERLQGPPRWDLLRFDLEQSEVSLDVDHSIPDKVRNQRTQIIGYRLLSRWFPKDKNERLPEHSSYDLLKTKSILENHMVILCVRQSMPLGARAYVPLERNPRAIKFMEEMENMRNDDYYNQSALKSLMSGEDTDSTNERRKETIQQELHRMKNILGVHPSEQEIREHHVENEVKDRLGYTLHTRCTYVDVPVVPSQKCFTCQRMGHHHKDACFLYISSEPHMPVMPWGASKFVYTLNQMQKCHCHKCQRDLHSGHDCTVRHRSISTWQQSKQNVCTV